MTPLVVEDSLWIEINPAFIGSFLMVRGVSLYCGGYPNEFTLIYMIQDGKTSVHWPFYLYLALMVILTVGRVLV